jgi:hypothetical protein
MDFTDKEKRERILLDAKREITGLKIMELLAKLDDDCEAVLTIDGHNHAFSSSQIFLPIIKGEIQEIRKAVKGRPNKWE